MNNITEHIRNRRSVRTEEGIWNVSGNGVNINVESKPGEGVLCFNVKLGTYNISKTDDAADEFVWSESEKEKCGDFIVYNSADRAFIRNELPNKLVGNVAYVPLKVMFKQFGATVEWDSSRGCAIAHRGANSAEIYPQAVSYILNGNTIELSSPTFVENGVMYVPVVDFKDFLKQKIQSDFVTLPIKNNQPNFEIMETFISAVEKLVIKDVVMYADRKIKSNKDIINK